GGLTISA
ncbi:putative replication protein O, partial [Escherichia coli 93.0055]